MKRRIWRRFWSIAGAVNVRWKIMGIVVAVVLILGASITYQLEIAYKSQLRSQVQETGVALGQSLSARSGNLVLTSQRFALFELAKEIEQSSKDVRYVYVADRSGEPLVHTFGQGFPRAFLDFAAPAEGQSYQVRRLATEQGVIQDIAVPVLGGRGGIAHVGMSESRVRSYINSNIRMSAFVIGAVLVLGSGGAFALATALTRPVKRLVEATKAIESGDFSKTAPVWASDEIGELGMAFNHMAEQLRESSEMLLQRNRDLEGLNTVASTANRARDQGAVIDEALEQVVSLTSARAAWVALLDDEDDSLMLAAERGLSAYRGSITPLDLSVCPCLASPSRAARREIRIGCPYGMGQTSKDGSPLVCVPLVSQGQPLGALNAIYAAEVLPDERQRQILLAVADQVGVALENARLLADLRHKEAVRGQLLEKLITAQEDERKRIARELHDETSQALTSLAVGLKSLESSISTSAGLDRLAQVQAMTTRAQLGVHHLAFQLRPSVLDEAGLAPAIDRFAREFSEQYDIPVDFQVIGSGRRLPNATETALYRIAQEALTNVIRHAKASHVSVLIERRNTSVLLLIEDNGQGFSPLELREDHERLGIHGMEERATLVGGRFTIESRPGAGTCVYVEVPVDRGPDEDE